MSDLGHIDPAFAQKLNAMVAASGGKLSIGNSYRSTARQQQLFDAAVKKYGSEQAARHWVAKPGSSKHQEGIAADLKGDLKWAHANAAKFGLYFPMEWEPWHIQPVGTSGSKAGKGTAAHMTTAPADGSTGPGNPDALDALTAPDLHDPKVQQANFLAILASPTAPMTGTY